MSTTLENVARDYKTLPRELEAAAAHCHTAAEHFLDKKIPRGCAHAFAVQGHLEQAIVP